MESLERHGIYLNFHAWKVMEFIVGHGKAICFLKTKRQKDKKIEKITDESTTTAFNFSRNRHRHAL